MKRIFLFGLLCLSSILAFAQDKLPLRVAVDNFYPPHVMRAGNNQLFGFDIVLITRICQLLNRTCTFYPMPFPKLMAQVEEGRMDIAVGAIAITPERSRRLNFSMPYLESKARFLGKKTIDPQSFNLDTLNTYRIGVEQGTIFPQLLTSLGVDQSQLTFYERLDSMIDALNKGMIDIAIMDNTSALYWQQESSGLLVVLGQAFNYGYGIAIAIHRNKTDLLKKINAALETYLKEKGFKENYDKYLSHYNDT